MSKTANKIPTAADHLAAYASGWTNVDGNAIAAACVDDYMLFDKEGLVVHKDELAEHVKELRQFGTVMELSDIVTDEDGDMITAWCKWQLGDIVGSGLIKVTDAGVVSEELFYFG